MFFFLEKERKLCNIYFSYVYIIYININMSHLLYMYIYINMLKLLVGLEYCLINLS